jgi:hypothetical protein
VCVHGNTSVALGGLGGTVTSEWHRHSMAQGGSEGAASRGIGRRHARGIDGEVIGQGVVGGVLTQARRPSSAMATPRVQEGWRALSLRCGVGLGFL